VLQELRVPLVQLELLELLAKMDLPDQQVV